MAYAIHSLSEHEEIERDTEMYNSLHYKQLSLDKYLKANNTVMEKIAKFFHPISGTKRI